MKTKKNKSTLCKYIEKLCIDEETDLTHLALDMGIVPQNLYRRLVNGKFTFEEIQAMADALGYDFDYKFTKRVEQPKEVKLN